MRVLVEQIKEWMPFESKSEKSNFNLIGWSIDSRIRSLLTNFIDKNILTVIPNIQNDDSDIGYQRAFINEVSLLSLNFVIGFHERHCKKVCLIVNMTVSLKVNKFRIVCYKAQEKSLKCKKTTFGALDQMHGYNNRYE